MSNVDTSPEALAALKNELAQEGWFEAIDIFTALEDERTMWKNAATGLAIELDAALAEVKNGD